VSTNAFTGQVTALGGFGGGIGGAGTIFYLNGAGIPALILLDNAGRAGTNTPITSYSGNVLADVVVRSNAIAERTVLATWTVSSLSITFNSSLVAPGPTGSSVGITAGTVTVDATSAINADGASSQYFSSSPAGGAMAASEAAARTAPMFMPAATRLVRSPRPPASAREGQ